MVGDLHGNDGKANLLCIASFPPNIENRRRCERHVFSRNLPGPAFALASHSSLALLLISVPPAGCFATFSKSVCWGWHDVLDAQHPIITAPQPRCVIGIVSQHELLPHTQQKNQTPDRPRDPRSRKAHLRHRVIRHCRPHSAPTRRRTRTKSQS
jgi:hypothetical protein